MRPAAASTAPGLGTAIGFGRATTGGAAGAVYHVTSPADDPTSPQPGTLRWGLMQPQPLWIVFDGNYTIQFRAGMTVAADKTIDGRGRRVVLTGHGVYGLQLYNTHNVIVENLILHDFGDVAMTKLNDESDAIDVVNSHDIWIDHNDLSMAGDKLIAIANGSVGITISWNDFHDQVDTIQIGAQAKAAVDAAATVTLHHNFFDRTAYRNPVVSYGKAHSFDNYIRGWTYYGARSERGAQLYLENNVFEATANKAATKTAPGRDGCNDKGTLCDTRPGYIRAVGNVARGGAKIVESLPAAVFTPSAFYAYHADPADDSLVANIVAHAGWSN